MQRTEWAFSILMAACFAPALFALADVWASVDYYSHGFLVPAVSVWAALRRRERLAGLPRRRELAGAAALAAALAVYFAGLAAGSVSAQGLGMVAGVAAAVWFLRGWAWLRALAFPVAYLVFMVPLPNAWLSPLIVKLQLFVSEAAIQGLHAFAVPVTREGNVVVLPGGDALFVAEACSGVTSVVTLLPLAVLVAYFFELGWRRGAVLAAAVLPIAMAANLLRVVGTVLAARGFGTEVVTREPLHSTAGLAVYVVGCLAMLAVGRLLVPGGALPRPAR